MDRFLSIRGVAKHFGSTVALHTIDLEMKSGEFLCLLGPSGCGKTTLLRILAGITGPTRGEIWMKDRRIDAIAPEKRNFGLVFQTYALFPHMTVEKNVAFGLEMRGVEKSQITQRVSDALRLVGLQDYARRLPRALSGGQQQRVALARAIVIAPDMLLFDEPLSNLDAKLRDSLREDLRSMQSKLGITSIYVTHDQTEAMALADRIVVMRDGNIVETGTPIDLYRRPKHLFTAEFLGMTNVVSADIAGDQCRLPWGAQAMLENPEENQSAGVAIRPEDLKIEAADPSEADGVVEQFMFVGANTHYWVKAAGETLRVVVSGGGTEILANGTPVRLITPTSLHQLRMDVTNKEAA